MSPERLKELRKKQRILMNLFVIPFALLIVTIGQWSIQYFYWMMAVMLLVQYLKGKLYPKLSFLARLFPFMAELTAYEQEKLGDQWPKVTGRSSLLNLVSAVIFGILALISSASPPPKTSLGGVISMCVAMFIAVNGSLTSQARKVDAEKLG